MNRLELNKSIIKKKFSSRILFENLEQILVNDIQWRLEDSKNSDVLFYNINDSEDAHEIFESKICKAMYGVLVLNTTPKIKLKNVIVVKNEKFIECQEKLLDLWYPCEEYLNNPQKKIVGITGTNGKTTTTHLCTFLAENRGKKAFSIGTLGIRDTKGVIGDTYTMTTPPLIELRKKLAELFKIYDVCFLEISSHSVVQNRLAGLKFNAGAWLSFTQDHLDYHLTIKDYFNAKLSFAKKYLREKAPLFVPNEQSDLIKKLKKYDFLKIPRSLDERKLSNLPSFYDAQFNKNNLEVSLGIIEYLYGEKENENLNLDQIPLPEGRFNIKTISGLIFIIDSAHTPDAISNICKEIKRSFKKHELWILFGCGGDRDPSKRSIMGKLVSDFADKIFLTSDNPRNEDPKKIINDIFSSMDSSKTEIYLERQDAVNAAVSQMNSNVILLLAGKGHEKYIIKGTVKHPYSEESAIEIALKKVGK